MLSINFITDIDYNNSFSLSGFNFNNNSLNYNQTKITETGWHLNFKGAANQMKTDSAIAKGSEKDGAQNYQLNLNGVKWINENLKFKSTIYGRDTKAYNDKIAKAGRCFSDNEIQCSWF